MLHLQLVMVCTSSACFQQQPGMDVTLNILLLRQLLEITAWCTFSLKRDSNNMEVTLNMSHVEKDHKYGEQLVRRRTTVYTCIAVQTSAWPVNDLSALPSLVAI